MLRAGGARARIGLVDESLASQLRLPMHDFVFRGSCISVRTAR